ncbi:MAG: methyltransferase domain-containing protein [Gemmatimonadetes bacterium]|nr:methyltransferase domain-containing protein [Gemmatimonadota bacterium]
MSSDFSNVYDDDERAESYADLEFPGTYWLAYRDIPALIEAHVLGCRALDFGCGTGRSTRFLRDLGFDVVGVDIAESMLTRAREKDPGGDYRRVPDGALPGLDPGSFDLILSAFTFDNIPILEQKVALLTELRRLLARGGRMVNLVSSPVIYTNEWTSFSTRDFPENRDAGDGDTVRIVMLDVADCRPVEDVLCTGEAYRDAFERAGLSPLQVHQPLGRQDEPFEWVSEIEVSPWVIYVLQKVS